MKVYLGNYRKIKGVEEVEGGESASTAESTCWTAGRSIDTESDAEVLCAQVIGSAKPAAAMVSRVKRRTSVDITFIHARRVCGAPDWGNCIVSPLRAIG